MLKSLMVFSIALLLSSQTWAERSKPVLSRTPDHHSFNHLAPNKLHPLPLLGETGFIKQDILPKPCKAAHLNRNTIGSCTSDFTHSLSIDPRKKMQKSQFEGLTGALTEDLILKARIDSKLEKKLAKIKQDEEAYELVENNDRHAGPVEVGYINGHSGAVRTYIGALKSMAFQKPVVNFDDHSFIYFDLVGILNPSSPFARKSASLFQRSKLKFLREGMIWVGQPAQKLITENLVNNAGIIEANYIYIQDNDVFLDHKPIALSSDSEKKYYLSQVLRAIHEHAQTAAPLENSTLTSSNLEIKRVYNTIR